MRLKHLWRPVLGGLCVALGCYLLFFHRLADRDLWSSHEARAGMDAQSVLDGEWLPRLYDGRPELQKPPLYYWLVAALARARGTAVDAWAVRLPSALAALGCVGLLLLLGWAKGRPRAGLLAGLALATGIHFTWLARIGRIDLPLAFTTTAALVALQLRERSRAFLVVAFAAAAAGVLLKGPIGLALPAAAGAARLLLEGRWPAFWELGAWRALAGRLGLVWGAALVLALTLPVFVWLENASGGRFGQEFFWAHNLERGLGGGRLRSHAWWLYGPYFLLYFLPWSPLVVAGALAGRGRAWRADGLARLGLAWLVGVVLLLSCARFKRADYLAPAYPGAALFVGCLLDRWLTSPWRRPLWAGVTATAVLVGAGWAWWVTAHLPAEEACRDYRPFAAEVRRRAPAPAPVLFFRTEAHALAFRTGPPLTGTSDWGELQARLGRPGEHFVVMPPGCLDECRGRLRGVCLEELARNVPPGGAHERPLVLLRGRAQGVER